MIGAGLTCLVGIASIFEGLQGTRPGYCWWWPTAWMLAPLLLTLAGVALLAVPVRRASAAEPRYGVGEGVPGYTGQFRRAVNNLAHQSITSPNGTQHPVSILTARGPVYVDGPGVVQEYDSTASEYGWALCALEGREVVAVDGEIWNALRASGSVALNEHPRNALGYPVPGMEATERIDANALRVELTGGTWGEGLLLRDSNGDPWEWEPKPAFGMNPISQAASWDRDSIGERLRMRVVCVLPLERDEERTLTAQRHSGLLNLLSGSALTHFLHALSAARGAELAAGPWRKGPNRNARDWLSYACDLVAPDGRVVLFAQVFMQLGKFGSTDIETWVELEIHDLEAWKAALDHAGATPTGDLRISTREVGEFFAIAWHTAAAILPAAAGQQRPARYSRPPASQFVLATDRQSSQPYPPLERYLDLEPLGDGGREHLERMSIAVTAAPPRDLDQARQLSRTALAEVAQHYEFLHATEADFA
jgi:hypothetical protein